MNKKLQQLYHKNLYLITNLIVKFSIITFSIINHCFIKLFRTILIFPIANYFLPTTRFQIEVFQHTSEIRLNRVGQIVRLQMPLIIIFNQAKIPSEIVSL